ncbi:hypothetical protein P154DRAFT_421902, partial [Amniculicola lignicola CBS 123094]
QQLKYGDKTHVIQTSSESYRCELYQSSGAGSDDLEFAGLVSHSIAVQKAEDVTAGVDSALEQLKSSMAAISEFKQANKTIVGDATPLRTPGHRRFPSKGFKADHLTASGMGSPLLNVPSSPGMNKKPPTSQPNSEHELIVRALRTPLIHLLAVKPTRDAALAAKCRTTVANINDAVSKIARRSPDDAEKWQLKDLSFRELKPWEFGYTSADDRDQAINNAVRAFDRTRLSKEDKLWQILLPRDERGKGKVLSRLDLKAVEQKTTKPGTPIHKTLKMNNEKKPKKVEEKDAEREPKKVREVKVKEAAEPKVRKAAKAKDDTPKREATTSTKAAQPSNRTPTVQPGKERTKKTAGAPARMDTSSTPRVKPRNMARDTQKRVAPQYKPPVNTKPKNPSPLSASPPVNASDFEETHPVHKALSAAPSPAKMSSGNSDRSLKRKANDLDSDIHNHNLSIKQPRVDRPTPTHTPNGLTNGNTPSSTNSLKRKSDTSSSTTTPSSKARKINAIDTAIARYPVSHHPISSSQATISPGASSSSTTSPTIPSLSFRQTVELSQKFQKYYKKYEELYWQLAESDLKPTEAQRGDLMKMHRKLEEMKREIKAGARSGH